MPSFSKRLEWILLLILFAGAIYFQFETWNMYLSNDSGFKIKEENIEEGPTLTFCPRDGYKIYDNFMVMSRLELLTYGLHDYPTTHIANTIFEGSNHFSPDFWLNQTVAINKSTIETLWGTCVMLETDFVYEDVR